MQMNCGKLAMQLETEVDSVTHHGLAAVRVDTF